MCAGDNVDDASAARRVCIVHASYNAILLFKVLLQTQCQVVCADLLERETQLRADFFGPIPGVFLDGVLDLVDVLAEGRLEAMELILAISGVLGTAVGLCCEQPGEL
jgi:hypothetical protein